MSRVGQWRDLPRGGQGENDDDDDDDDDDDLQANLGDHQDVQFGSDWSSRSVGLEDQVGFDLCVLASSSHTIITYGGSLLTHFTESKIFSRYIWTVGRPPGGGRRHRRQGGEQRDADGGGRDLLEVRSGGLAVY